MTGRILIVDDTATLRDALVAVIEAHGYRCATATSLACARKAIRQGPIEVALIDLELGHEDGSDLVPFVRAHAPTATTILMSGGDPAELARAGQTSGANLTIQKPFDTRLLMRILGATCRASQGRARVVTHPDCDGDEDTLEFIL